MQHNFLIILAQMFVVCPSVSVFGAALSYFSEPSSKKSSASSENLHHEQVLRTQVIETQNSTLPPTSPTSTDPYSSIDPVGNINSTTAFGTKSNGSTAASAIAGGATSVAVAIDANSTRLLGDSHHKTQYYVKHVIPGPAPTSPPLTSPPTSPGITPTVPPPMPQAEHLGGSSAAAAAAAASGSAAAAAAASGGSAAAAAAAAAASLPVTPATSPPVPQVPPPTAPGITPIPPLPASSPSPIPVYIPVKVPIPKKNKHITEYKVVKPEKCPSNSSSDKCDVPKKGKTTTTTTTTSSSG